MNFNNLVEIIGGELLNTPSISRFESIEVDSKKTKWGDLFIAHEQKDIDIALENGAYGILSDFDADIKDQEIAWIRVNNIENSLKKLLRYKLLKDKFKFFYCTSVEVDIIKSITKKSDFIFLDDNMYENFKKIINSNDKNIIISSNKQILHDIYPNFLEFKPIQNNIKIIYKTLFTTSLIYNDYYYEDLKLPSLFINSLGIVLAFLKDENISFDISRITLENHFKAIFITDKFKIKNFGDSEHVIIVEQDARFIDKELKYIQNFAKWSKFTYMTLNDLSMDNIDKFNFILIEANYNEVIKYIEKFSTRKSLSLFMEL